MDGRDEIRMLLVKIKPFKKDLILARDKVAAYSNDVYESIHANERRIHAREAVRHLDFARELLKLATYHIEQSLEWENVVAPINKDK